MIWQFSKKILEYCTQIAGTHKRFNDSYEQFETDFIYRNSICLCLLQIGELSGKLSNEFREDNDEIPWHAIRGMRNMVAHEYGHIDIPTLWNTSHKYILELKSFCETVLAVEEAEDISQGFMQKMWSKAGLLSLIRGNSLFYSPCNPHLEPTRNPRPGVDLVPLLGGDFSFSLFSGAVFEVTPVGYGQRKKG